METLVEIISSGIREMKKHADIDPAQVDIKHRADGRYRVKINLVMSPTLSADDGRSMTLAFEPEEGGI